MSLPTQFLRNDDDAKRVVNTNLITKTGAYEGTIVQAALRESQNGATGIDIAFKSRDGQMAHITMWILNRDGGRTYMHGIFDAIMVVLGLESTTAKKAYVYTRKGEKAMGYRITDIENKPIGLVIQREQRFYIDQQDGVEKETWQLNIRTPYDIATRRVAKEILDDEEAKRLDALLANLSDKPGKHVTGASTAPTYTAADMSPTEKVEEDIPF